MSTISGSSTAALRRGNSRAVLAVLLADDRTASVSELAATVGLSRPTVEAALADLVAEGWVLAAEPAATPNRAGRPAKRYGLAADAGVAIGVELGLHGIVAVLADLRGTHLARVEESDDALRSAGHAGVRIRAVVDRLLDGVDRDRVLAVTYGVPAIVDRAGRIDHTAAAPDWVSGHMLDRLPEVLPTATTVFDNDAKLAAEAERTWGRLRGVQDGIALVMGRQVGAALVVNGAVARGAHGSAGEIGALPATGWSGASARLEARIPAGTGLPSVMAAAAAGDAPALEAVRALATDVAPGVAHLVAALDPEVVVVGGEVLPAADAFCAALAEAVAPLLRHPGPIVASSVGRDAVALGALARALAHVRAERMGLA